uniref:StAR related lipid transfer domain containing 13 n=1 Tax=Nomascus leucogenys TaxID=61853 RepID=G1QKB2_NOMLE
MFSQVPRTPASGCYYLNSMTPEGQEMYLRFDQTTRRSPYRMSRILARHQLVTKIQQEIEAKEACDWLRAAGFPQYAQLYEDSQFPINIVAVKNDHDFLEKDLVEPLCRRLNTLNKCASMKLDVNFQRKKGDDSDEEDLCISNKWTFQRTSRRWSRVDDLYTLLPRGDRNGSPGGTGMRNTTSSESVLTDLSEPEVCSIHSESSGGSDSRSQPGQCCTDSPVMLDAPLVSSSLPQCPRDVLNHPFHPKNEKPTRARAKSFLKRMETLRGKGAHGRHKGSGRTGGLVISGPMLQQEPESFKAMQCIQIPNGDLRNSPPPACRKGLPCSGESSGESSPSEHSSSGVSTPCLKERKCHEANKRGGMYLEDLDVLAGTALPDAGDQSRMHEFHSQENLVVHIPKDHKPGTFPKALSIESLSPTDSSNGVNWRTGSISLGREQVPGAREPRLMASCHRASRVSIYDNVPGSHLYASTGDLLDLEKDDLFPHLDDILQHVNGLQEVVDDWSKDVLPELQTHDTLVGEPGLSPFPSPNQITLDFEGNSVSEGRTTPSDVERDVTSLNESEPPGVRDRRDSGVGASLTRPNRRLRWNSFQLSHQPRPAPASPHISSQTANQLSLLQRFSLLRLTAIMEKHSMSNKHGWTWSVPKFMKRMKVPDYKDKAVFGVPLIVHVQRTGQPLPQSIQQALRYLRSNCLDQVGLFRKSGVKSRIHALRQMNENFPENVNYEDQSAYDVADMVKQFFRDLPEPLFTNKLSETFLHIYQVGDGNPLKLWKASVEVEAPPSVVLNRVLRERHLWDEDFVQWKVVETLDRQTEIYQYVLNSMAPHPSRDFVVLRTWKTDLPKGMCTLVSLSVEHEEAQLLGGVRAVVMDSQYLIEPCGSGKSRLTHVCRVDLKGHSPEWYSKGFGHLCAAEVARIRNSFQPLIAEGPETKI